MKPTIIPGPPVSAMTKQAATEALQSHPRFPKDADFAIDEIDGRWIAAYVDPMTKEAAPPFGGDGEGAVAGPPPATDPSTDSGPAAEGPPTDDAEGEDGPPKEDGEGEKGEGKEHGEKGVEAQLHAVTEMLHTLMTALGLDQNPADSMVPGADAGVPGAPGPSEADLGGPAQGASDPSSGGEGKKERVVHERSMKPGEAQPGSTPVGAPAFASVRSDHPWREVIGKVRSFTAVEHIDEETSMAEVAAELNELADGTGYRIDQLLEGREAGQRVAKALLVR